MDHSILVPRVPSPGTIGDFGRKSGPRGWAFAEKLIPRGGEFGKKYGPRGGDCVAIFFQNPHPRGPVFADDGSKNLHNIKFLTSFFKGKISFLQF